MEIPIQEQKSIDAYLEGALEDESQVLNGRFFSQKIQDGRASLAVLSLISRIRCLRRAGANIAVHAIADKSETAMASNIRERMLTEPDSKSVLLVGNLHASLKKRDSDKYVPLGYQLRDLDVLSFVLATGKGKAWNCRAGRCGVHDMPGVPKPASTRELTYPVVRSLHDGAYSGYVYSESSTASLPAAIAKRMNRVTISSECVR